MSDAATPEPVRLVVWDLDETFWRGTLTEGGMTYRRDVHDIVVALAGRGIVSSICSKNDHARVQAILEAEGIWEYFVFPSINWDAKGPRMAALVEAVQLRAPTILFIDDNPMNLAEAQHYVPGLQVAAETCIEGLLDNPLLRGKPDPDMTRLRQYRLLQRRQADQAHAGGDNAAFLRESGIIVTIDHDLDLHLDRAIELINRTNQLNYTKTRLPEDMDAARAALRTMLSAYSNQAGIVRVRDRYGDYGYCGLYIMNSGQHAGAAGLRLHHFCFSCRILNMGVETWLYRRLGRPMLRQRGEVLTDVVNDTRDIDWITLETADGPAQDAAAGPKTLDYVFARGGCDLRAVTHYFGLVADTVYGEFNIVEDGLMLPLHHSAMTRNAMLAPPPEAMQAVCQLGYKPHHFESAINGLPENARAIWLLSFWGEGGYALYRHNATGVCLPVAVPNHGADGLNLLEIAQAESGVSDPALAVLRREFSFEGLIGKAAFKNNVRLMMKRVSPGTSVFILLGRTEHTRQDGTVVQHRKMARVNRWLTELADEIPAMHLLQVMDFVKPGEETANPGHFDRKVYFRIYQEIMRQVQSAPLQAAAE